MSKEQVPYDLIETTVASIPPSPTHEELVTALRKRLGREIRYATSRDGFSLSRERCQVISTEGESLGELRDWLKAELAACNGSISAVWERHKNGPLRITESEISYLYLVAPFGDTPEAFHQIEIKVEHRYIDRLLFDPRPWKTPRNTEDFYSTSIQGDSVDRVPFGHPSYQLHVIHNIQDVIAACVEADAQQKQHAENLHLVALDRFGKETGLTRYFDKFPELRTLPPNGRRLIDDWAASSAGQSGAIFSDHWVLSSISDRTDTKGRRWVSVVPGWTTKKKLPEIKLKENESAYGLWDRLLAFDKKAGHPFAWYFYMLHGNRVHSWAAQEIFKAVEQGLIVMPDRDYIVLHHWYQHQYGF